MSSRTWLRGTTVRKNGASTTSTRSNTPHTSHSTTSTVIFGGGVKDASGRTTEYFSEDDQCPVCKSDRYLNPKLRLLVSSCYHKMCESCIDRLFTLGPAPCPICSKTLRKLAFIPQTFEDLTVEKEVSVRRRMAKEFNKRREDFPNLQSFNNYLEDVEDIIFNLINDIDIPQTEVRIAAYRAENAAITELNAQREEAYAQALREQEAAERRERQERAAALKHAEEEERAVREAERRALIDTLEDAPTEADAARLVLKSKKEAHRRAVAAARATAATLAAPSAYAGPATTLDGARLRARAAAAAAALPDKPHVPFADSWYDYADKYNLRETYFDPPSDPVRRDRDGIMRAGGYRVEEAWERALRAGVAGLDIQPLADPVPNTGTDGGDVLMATA